MPPSHRLKRCTVRTWGPGPWRKNTRRPINRRRDRGGCLRSPRERGSELLVQGVLTLLLQKNTYFRYCTSVVCLSMWHRYGIILPRPYCWSFSDLVCPDPPGDWKGRHCQCGTHLSKLRGIRTEVGWLYGYHSATDTRIPRRHRSRRVLRVPPRVDVRSPKGGRETRGPGPPGVGDLDVGVDLSHSKSGVGTDRAVCRTTSFGTGRPPCPRVLAEVGGSYWTDTPVRNRETGVVVRPRKGLRLELIDVLLGYDSSEVQTTGHWSVTSVSGAGGLEIDWSRTT